MLAKGSDGLIDQIISTDEFGNLNREIWFGLSGRRRLRGGHTRRELRARRKPVQLGSLVENSVLERRQLRRRLDPNLFDEVVTQTLESAECLSLTTGTIERHHQLGPESLPERVLGYRCFAQRDDVRIVAGCEPSIEPCFRRRQPEILQPNDFRCRPTRPSNIEERGTSPKLQGALQDVLSPSPICSAQRFLPGGRCQLKRGRVQLTCFDDHRVTTTKTDDPIGSERSA